jgi:hypothetical protein
MILVVLFCWSALGLSGCGGTATVSGTVKYRGKPLTCGAVTFVDDSGKGTMPAYLHADGTYVARNVPTGSVKIVVNSLLPEPPMAKPERSDPEYETKYKEYEASAKSYEARMAGYVQIPERYADANASGKTFEVKSGSNVCDIDLD